MSKRTFNRALRRSALTVALGVCFNTTLYAQSNTSGSVFGQASAGETVLVESPETGFSREISVSADGTYRLSALSPGSYRVTLRRGDGTTSVRDIVVKVGTGTSVNFAAGASAGSAGSTGTSGATDLDRVTVTASAVNPIDVSSVESTTILTAEQINRIPVARDTTSVALLAPGTVRGDNAFGNLASFGGSSVAENQYYVNGFNVTNSFRSLNFSKIPFEGIAEQQIKTGGYGAEFGRSTGGVVNQITKRGTNEFQAGANVFWTPESLRDDVENTFYSNPLVPGDLGDLRQDNSKDTEDLLVSTVWAGGALIQDRLFAYGLVQYGKTTSDIWGSTIARTNNHDVVRNPNWLVKLDWNINDSHKLEFTAFSDLTKTKSRTYLNTQGELDRNDLVGTSFSEAGGETYIGRYTGYLTDNFTLSAMYGHSDYSRSRRLVTANGTSVEYGGDLNVPATGCPVIADIRPGYRQTLTGVYSSICNITGGSIDRVDSGDTRDQYRIDADWQLGDHRIRFGYDGDDFESVAGQSIEGGRTWRYSTNNGPDGLANTGDEFDIVREQITTQGSTVKVKQFAYYVEDTWSITDNFLAYLGLRWDTFENLNGEGQSYVKIDNQFAPRLGFSWNVNGDSSLKIYGNAGRYALPLTPSVAVRGASASLFTRQNFNFTGVDPLTGAPTGITPRGGLSFINGEFGDPKNPATIAATNLKPMYQDEFILGFQASLGDHMSYGARGIYRKLQAAIDDNCDYTAITELADAAGMDYVLPNAGFPYCRMYNPGEDSVFLTDLLGDGNLTEFTVPADRLGPSAKRSYKALELFLDGSWDRFFFQGSYTLAYNKGNTEGGVKSDIGQADTSVTQDFDYKELAVDSYGFLPNDRRHSLKLFGNYEFSDQWSMGANLIVQSGRPINCLGVLYPYNGGIHPYGSSFFRCGTTEAGGGPGVNGPNPAVAVPRGTAGRLPWTNALDLSLAYRPNWASGLQFKVDVFNVLNNQKVTSLTEVAEDATTGAPLNTYLLPRTYQAPRTVRFMVQYDF
ncbi:MAG: TonB-dependent receptor [Lysobacteraceae bacterium]|nr:MAG: TonB-dependent receptor [Xanthomonadaceae bacterium]